MAVETRENKHITFDEDEDFENMPALETLRKDSSSQGADDSDSDAAPEEATIAAGKEAVEKEDENLKSEVDRLRQQIKEKRKKRHERNKQQQQEKRKRLELRRLPESLLNAVAEEQKTRSLQQQQEVTIKKKQTKRKKFLDLDGEDSDGIIENVDDEGNITLDTGVKVRALNEEVKKTNEIAVRAAEFRQNALYGKRVKRMSSKALRQMKEKQIRSGKNVLVGKKA